MTQLTTARLRLEPLTDHHLDGLNLMNSDPEVMRYLSGKPETREETMAVIARVKARWADTGYSWWAAMALDTGELVGAGALQNLRREMTLLPDPACPLEMGWRLRRDYWGLGLASEIAIAIRDYAFQAYAPDELLAVCNPDNGASSAVMARVGMQPQGLQHWYGQELTTYRMDAAQWRSLAGGRHATPAR
jgi:RimJ/RimL family protein N-acetyltransferase